MLYSSIHCPVWSTRPVGRLTDGPSGSQAVYLTDWRSGLWEECSGGGGGVETGLGYILYSLPVWSLPYRLHSGLPPLLPYPTLPSPCPSARLASPNGSYSSTGLLPSVLHVHMKQYVITKVLLWGHFLSTKIFSSTVLMAKSQWVPSKGTIIKFLFWKGNPPKPGSQWEKSYKAAGHQTRPELVINNSGSLARIVWVRRHPWVSLEISQQLIICVYVCIFIKLI